MIRVRIFSMSTDDAQLASLVSLLAAIARFPDPRRATAEWKQAYNLLKKTPAAGSHLDNLIARRDVEALRAVIESMQAAQSGEPVAAGPVIEDAILKAALKGFKRRLKLVKLDEDSRIDRRDPLSGGGTSDDIAGIEPPRDWGSEVWAELVRRGALKHAGGGTYQFVTDLPA